MIARRFSRSLAVLPLCLALVCTACTESAPDGVQDRLATQTRYGTIATVLNELPELTTLSQIVAVTEVGSVFDGPGVYTILAPRNAAFEAFDPDGSLLKNPEQRVVLIAILREHVLPGQLTRENIAAAIGSNGGPVTMTTLGGTDIVFSAEGNGITADNGQGSQARLTNATIAADNGAIIRIDAVLVPGGAATPQ